VSIRPGFRPGCYWNLYPACHGCKALVVVYECRLLTLPSSSLCFSFSLLGFFEDFTVSSPSHKVEVFVAAGGKLDVLMTIHGPLTLGQVYEGTFEGPIMSEPISAATESDSETQTFVTNFKPSAAGTYAICLDNRHSRMVSKVVQVGVVRRRRWCCCVLS
jgi:hypothetical protein